MKVGNVKLFDNFKVTVENWFVLMNLSLIELYGAGFFNLNVQLQDLLKFLF